MLFNRLCIYGFVLFSILKRKVTRRKTESKNVAIISINHMGECIMFLDCFRTLCDYFYKKQGCSVTFIGNKSSCNYYANFAKVEVSEYIAIDEEFDLKEKFFTFKNFYKLYKILEKKQFCDLVLPFETWYGVMLSLCLSSKRKHIVQNSKKITFLYKLIEKEVYSWCVWEKEEMLLKLFKRLLISMGIKDYKIKIGQIEKQKLKGELKEAVEKLGDYCVVVPGAKEQLRQWETDKFISVINRMVVEKDISIILMGDKDEVSIGDNIMKGIRDNKRVLNLIGKTNFEELNAVLSKSIFVLGNDTGTIHMAATLNIPTLTLMTYKDYGKYHPYVVDECNDSVLPKGIWCKTIPTCKNCEISAVRIKKKKIANEQCVKNVVKEDLPVWCLSCISVQQVNSEVDGLLSRI